MFFLSGGVSRMDPFGSEEWGEEGGGHPSAGDGKSAPAPLYRRPAGDSEDSNDEGEGQANDR